MPPAKPSRGTRPKAGAGKQPAATRQTTSARHAPVPGNKKPRRSAARHRGFPIIGIGASAGGLEAFEQFFTQTPPDTGMAFVLVQHLDPTHKSILGDLVRRYTRMQVLEVEDGMTVQPDCAYIIPPNRDMAILNGNLHLIEPVAPRGRRLPIDYFFRSLAQDQQERAVAIVLSGTGTDGTLGAKAIKGEGGMVMVQDSGSARYDGMPRSALNAGVADYVLPAAEMPRQLLAYMELASGKKVHRATPARPVPEDELKRLFILVRSLTGHDFSLYKDTTILRRIERRMTVNQIGELRLYVRYLQQNPLEVQTLFKELLIGVTSFFRDPEAFEALRTRVIPAIFRHRPRDRAVRVWVPGCSTGEEAYSIAMLIRDYMSSNKLEHDAQVFATDIDAESIETARQGIYPESISVDVPQAYLKQYFVHKDNTLQVEQALREMMVFATQNITRDPPFSKLDLLSCRNVLIYMGPELQRRVLPLFHYSLVPGGYLFLGPSESLGDSAELFDVTDRKWKIFKSGDRTAQAMPMRGFPLPRTDVEVASRHVEQAAAAGRRLSYREVMERILLRDYTPAAVLVDNSSNILFIHGSTGSYLEPARGEASLNLLQMARKGLKLELTMAIRKARNRKTDVRVEGVMIDAGETGELVDITVRAITEPPALQGLMLVLFEHRPVPESEGGEKDRITVNAGGDERVRELEHELAVAQQHLQTTIEELETSNEEITSTNEEMQSSNEELQSTNEELETSKEELQSINEELMTVNSELEAKIHELSQANNDMNNLMAATEIGTLFLDMDLNIKRFTPSVTGVIKLIQGDLGRPLSDIASNIGGIDISERSAQVLESLAPFESEVATSAGRYYLLRILPYRTTRNIIDGVVITLVDISAQRSAEQLFRESLEYSLIATLITNARGQITLVNREAEKLFGWSRDELMNQSLENLIPDQFRAGHRKLRKEYMKDPAVRVFGERRPLACLRKDGSTFQAEIGLVPLRSENGMLVMANIRAL